MMRILGLILAAVAACCSSAAAAAGLGLSGKTWISNSCLVTLIFDRNGTFGEYNDLGEDHFGRWTVESGDLYMVFEDNTYLKAGMSDDFLIVNYPERAGEVRDCFFTSTIRTGSAARTGQESLHGF